MFLRGRDGTRQIFALQSADAAVAAVSAGFTAAAPARRLLLARRIVAPLGPAVADEKRLVGVGHRLAGRRLVADSSSVVAAGRRAGDGAVQTAAAAAAMRRRRSRVAFQGRWNWTGIGQDQIGRRRRRRLGTVGRDFHGTLGLFLVVVVVMVVVQLLLAGADVSRAQVENGVGRAQVLRLPVHHHTTHLLLRRQLVVMQVMVVQVVIAGQFAGERLDPTLDFDAGGVRPVKVSGSLTLPDV